MKSCLKHSPPTTPNLSNLSSPSSSRCCTPPPTPTTARKCVSFCSESEGLEEVFEADDWDRSPTPMTPKLSYQDMLELKQLQLSLPRAPQNPSYQRPFTTSAPRSTYCGPPISRFAAAPSLTPAKWKNRDDTRHALEPEILPYLEAVPIQLLPLMDTPPETPQSATPTPTPSEAQSCSTADTKLTDPEPSSFNLPSTSIASASTSTVQSPSPIEVTAPTASSLSPSSSPLSSSSASASSTSSSQSTPIVAPTVIIDSPTSPASARLPSPATATSSIPPFRLSAAPPPPVKHLTPKSTPLRRVNQFQFLPLLPVQDEPRLPPEPPVQKPVEVKRKLNMAFVPLLPPSEPQLPPPSEVSASVSNATPAPPPPPLAQQTSLPEPALLEAVSVVEETLALTSLESEGEDITDNESPSSSSTTSSSLRHKLMTIPLYASPSSSATPSLSSASDTDEMDLDTESEAPSVVDGSSAPSSPGEKTMEAEPEYLVVDGEVVATAPPSSLVPGSVNPYFPILPSTTRGPHTPRQEPFPADVCHIARPNQTPYIGRETMIRKVKLEAIPSPSLVPPSPFSLYPPSPETLKDVVAGGGGGGARRMGYVRSGSKLSLLSLEVEEVEERDGEVMGRNGKEVGAMLKPSFSRRRSDEERKGDVEMVEVAFGLRTVRS